jgi:hypothetical protein
MNVAYGLILVAFTTIVSVLGTRAYIVSKIKLLGSIIVVDDNEDGQTYMAADLNSKSDLDGLKGGDVAMFVVKRK